MKYLFLALLSKQPTHGYDLLQTYEQLFSAVLPPLNAGQIYTTLSRLERDGLVQKFTVEQVGKPDKQIYQLTDQGRQTLTDWFIEPLTGPRLKDNFFIKLISAQISHLAQTQQLIEGQRKQYLQSMHDLNNLALSKEISENPNKFLLIQGAILHLKADLTWLDLCEDAFVTNE
ncbi:MAG TPA: PadR family transcriptional regulator [Chloroflexi bacterium]|nr:PadR family transcriptional regulator [Chloroflexota bacterium]